MSEFYEKLEQWNKLKEVLSQVKEKEIALRFELFGEAFPNPEEGTLYHPLGNGWRLQGRYKLERNIEIPQLGYMRDALATKFNISIDPLLNWKVSLQLANYRQLPQPAKELFDNIITAKPGSPQLAIIPPTDEQATPTEEATQPETVAAEKVDTETGEVTTVQVPAKKKTTRSRKKAA